MLNEDTKLEVELSGEIDSSAAPAAAQEGVGKKSMFGGGMSLPVPISLSQPAVKEWFGRRKANVRPFGVFFNTSNFQVDHNINKNFIVIEHHFHDSCYCEQVPPSAGRLTKRLYKNVEYFQSNYVLVFFVLVLYCLITSPLLIIVIAATGGACYIAGLKNAERKLSIAGENWYCISDVVLGHKKCILFTNLLPLEVTR